MKEMKQIQVNDQVYEVVDEKARKNLANRPVNNNILINSNFANPVNQRDYVSGTVVSQDMYTIDRWCISSGIKIELNTNGITLEMTSNDNDGKGWFIQRLEDTDFLTGKIVTYSAKINGVVYSNTVTLNKTSGLQGTIVGDGFNLYMGYAPSKDAYDIDIELQKDSSITIEWIKLELGEVATPYVPRLYAEELQLCKRYYQVHLLMTASLYSVMTDSISYEMELCNEMRTSPTATLISPFGIQKNGESGLQTGFNIQVVLVNQIRLIIGAYKNSHGLIASNLPRISGGITLDAEL